MNQERKYKRSYATHFIKLDKSIRFYQVLNGRLYVWIADRWMYECWFKDFPESFKSLMQEAP